MSEAKPPEQLLAEKRAALKNALRAQYLKQATSPYQDGMVFDSGVQRFMAMKATATERFKPGVRNFVGWVSTCLLPIAILVTVVHKDKTQREARLRNGEVKYKDRMFKLQG